MGLQAFLLMKKFQFSPSREGGRWQSRAKEGKAVFQFSPSREGGQQKWTQCESHFSIFVTKCSY